MGSRSVCFLYCVHHGAYSKLYHGLADPSRHRGEAQELYLLTNTFEGSMTSYTKPLTFWQMEVRWGLPWRHEEGNTIKCIGQCTFSFCMEQADVDLGGAVNQKWVGKLVIYDQVLIFLWNEGIWDGEASEYCISSKAAEAEHLLEVRRRKEGRKCHLLLEATAEDCRMSTVQGSRNTGALII